MTTPRTPSRVRAFTLVELLLTLATVALLLGIMLPALRHAREAARTAACLSNVRQLAGAVFAYAGDYRSSAPPGASNFLRNRDRWHGSRSATNQPFEPAGGSLSAYLGDELAGPERLGVRACPTFRPTLAALATARAGFERGNGGYGYNNAFLGVVRRRQTTASGVLWPLVTDRRGERVENFIRPSAAIAFADSALADTSSPVDETIEYSFVEPRKIPTDPGFRLDPSIHFRHATGLGGGLAGSPGRAATAFLDGHAATETRTLSHNSGIYGWPLTDRGIGWFGSDDDNRLFAPMPDAP